MNLTFDRIASSGNAMVYAMAHWFEQQGDLVRDPEMIIEIRQNLVEALSIQHCPPFDVVVEVFNEDRTKYDPSQKRSQNQFLNTWLTNIKNQRYTLVKAGRDR